VHVGVWCLGEFGDHLVSGRAVGPDNNPIHVAPADVLDLINDVILKPPNVDKAPITHSLCAAALIKLVTRCPSEFERIRKALRRFECSLHVDLQQRSCEFLELLGSDWDATRAGILDRMPVSDREIAGAESRDIGETSIEEVHSAASQRPKSSGKDDLLDLLLDDPAPQTSASNPPASGGPSSLPVGGGLVGGGGGGGDLLDLLDGGSSAPPAAGPAPTIAAGGPADLGLLGDIFGGSTISPPTTAPQEETVTMTAYDKAGLKIVLHCKKNADGSTGILAKFGNSLDVPMVNFTFEAAVPKYVKLNLSPASGQMLPPKMESVTQQMTCVNSSNGERPLLLKLRLSYTMNGQSVQEMHQVRDFPAGF